LDAEDVAQEALVQAWRSRSKLRDPDRWAEWLGQITKNKALRRLERQLPTPVEEFEDRGEEDYRLHDLVEGAGLQLHRPVCRPSCLPPRTLPSWRRRWRT